MEDINFIEAVAERDIDLLLLEEFHCSPAFRAWFGERVFGAESPRMELIGAWHSLTHPVLGESDPVLVENDSVERKRAVLIENKIGASPQPDQAARYAERGRLAAEKGTWHEFRTCIVAPERAMAHTSK